MLLLKINALFRINFLIIAMLLLKINALFRINFLHLLTFQMPIIFVK